jgi:acetylornithine deacetylase/succinyl-diaminopimelate desuccinylase-like protein
MTNSLYLTLLSQFIIFRSISTNPQYIWEINACADWLIDIFEKNNFETKLITGYGNPLVYSSYHHDDALPTLLIYGHYDVQPADQDDGWQSDPFVLTEHDGRYVARGAVDNKGQVMIHIATVLEAITNKHTLRYNIKFLIEGDEETWSPHISQALIDHQELLACDYVLVSDGEIIGNHTPTMVAGFRGWANLTLTLQTAKTNLHSGLYGNIAPSASHEAAKFIAKLYNDNNHITIPGRYDDIAPITPDIVANNKLVPFDFAATQAITGIQALATPHGYDPVTANGLLPTIQVSGIQSGYTAMGYNNIIPGSALVKINFRFAPGQDPALKIRQFEEFVKKELPDYVSRQIQTSDPYSAITIQIYNKFNKQVSEVLSEVYNKQTVVRYCGAAVPITGLFQDILKATVAIADLGNEDCNMHGVNENFDLTCVEKGLQFSKKFLTF